MDDAPDPLTTAIQLPPDDETITAVLRDRYDRMDRGEARGELERLYGDVLTEDELVTQFDVQTTALPYVHVIRKDGGVRGTFAVIDKHKLYFLFKAEDANERKAAQI